MILGFLLCWFKEKPKFDPDIPMLRDCESCKHCVLRGMCNRMTVHLIEDHKLEDEHAYSTVDWIFNRVREHRKKRRLEETT